MSRSCSCRFAESSAEFQHPCRDRNDSQTWMQCTVDSLYCSTCVVIYIFHICTHDHAYSDKATDINHALFTCPTFPYDWHYALTPIATDCLHVLEHILFLLTHLMCTIRTFSIVMITALSSSLFSYANCFA